MTPNPDALPEARSNGLPSTNDSITPRAEMAP